MFKSFHCYIMDLEKECLTSTEFVVNRSSSAFILIIPLASTSVANILTLH